MGTEHGFRDRNAGWAWIEGTLGRNIPRSLRTLDKAREVIEQVSTMASEGKCDPRAAREACDAISKPFQWQQVRMNVPVSMQDAMFRLRARYGAKWSEVLKLVLETGLVEAERILRKKQQAGTL